MAFRCTIEGKSDRGVIKAIGSRYRIRISTHLMHGNEARKVKGRVSAYPRDIHILVKDLHTYKEESIRAIFNRVKRLVHEHSKENIKLVIVRHEIEAWFLADINAINRTYNCRLNVEYEQPEEIEDAADELHRLLQNVGKGYYKSEKEARKIMTDADFDVIAEKCPSFRELLNHLCLP